MFAFVYDVCHFGLYINVSVCLWSLAKGHMTLIFDPFPFKCMQWCEVKVIDSSVVYSLWTTVCISQDPETI